MTTGVPRRVPVPVSSPNAAQSHTSPTESDFADPDEMDSVKLWDEERVCDYLRSVKCGEYEQLFRKNHINGENLLEMDKEVLKEMGIEKVGDRVRLFLGIKKLRTKAYANQKKRNRVSADQPYIARCQQLTAQDSFSALDFYATLPPSTLSPQNAPAHPRSAPTSANRRYSRQIDVPAPLETGMSKGQVGY